jgi:hypothetical protein
MALLRRAPREVYRVFSEADFLASGDARELFEPAATEAGGRAPLRRIAAAAMLLGAVAVVLAMILVRRPPPQAPVRPVAPSAGAPAAEGGTPRMPSSAAPAPRELHRARPLRHWRRFATMRSREFAASVRFPAGDPREVADAGSPPFEHAEFGFER